MFWWSDVRRGKGCASVGSDWLNRVTTVRDGNADLAVEGGGAALERPGDPEALAAAIRDVSARADPDRCRAVAERFDETEMLDLVVDVLTR